MPLPWWKRHVYFRAYHSLRQFTRLSIDERRTLTETPVNYVTDVLLESLCRLVQPQFERVLIQQGCMPVYGAIAPDLSPVDKHEAAIEREGNAEADGVSVWSGGILVEIYHW